MRHDCMEPMLVSNQPFIVCAVHLVCINACVLNYIDYYTIKFEFRRLACDDCRDWRLTTEYSNPWPIRRLISPGKTECAYVSRMCDIFLIFIRAPAAAGVRGRQLAEVVRIRYQFYLLVPFADIPNRIQPYVASFAFNSFGANQSISIAWSKRWNVIRWIFVLGNSHK